MCVREAVSILTDNGLYETNCIVCIKRPTCPSPSTDPRPVLCCDTLNPPFCLFFFTLIFYILSQRGLKCTLHRNL